MNTVPEVDPEAVNIALEEALKSERFQSAPKLGSFLRYVVEQRLFGDENKIKAYSIAVDALGRPDSFDPQSDPQVRVLAGRLRAALRDYYANEGHDSRVRIELPKGRYVPNFIFNNLTVDPSPKGKRVISNAFRLGFLVTAAFTGIVLVAYFSFSKKDQVLPPSAALINAVMPQVAFEVTSTGGGDNSNTKSVKLRADDAIKRYGELYVPRSSEGTLALKDGQPAFLVNVVVENSSSGLQAILQVVDHSNGVIVASSGVGIDDQDNVLDFSKFETEISTMFSQNGPVFQYVANKSDLGPDLKCVITALRKRDTENRAEQSETISCLEAAFERHPNLGIAGVQLATRLIDEGKQRRLYKEQNAIVQARQILEHVLDKHPKLPGALMEMADATFTQGNSEAAFRFDQEAIDVNPNSGQIRGWAGRRLVQSGVFEKGLREMRRSIKLSTQPRRWQRTYYYLALLQSGEIKESLEQAPYLELSTVGVNGIAGFLANINLGMQRQAAAILQGLFDKKTPTEDALLAILIDEGFKKEAAQMIAKLVIETPEWKQASDITQ